MFTKPIEHIITSKSLKSSFEHINPRASGIDHVSYESFKNNLLPNIEALVREVVSDTYAPQPMERIERRIRIAKEYPKN